MPQIFGPASNTISKVSIAVVVLLLGGTLAVGYIMDRGSWMTFVQVAPEQPIPFSHKHHVRDDGIDCRYCHASVETSAFAGIPPTTTCMNCHSMIWSNAPVLAPVRQSYQTGQSIQWTRVNYVPQFVYFNHSIHIHK